MIHVGYKLTFQQTDQVTKWIYSSKFTVFSGTACSSELEFLQQIRVCHRDMERWSATGSQYAWECVYVHCTVYTKRNLKTK